MTKTVAPTKAISKKRGQGRPVSGENDVGRERLLVATEKLLRTLPPARVTISRIAQEANADPALIRYYFGNRAALLVAVVDRVTAHPQRNLQRLGLPTVALADHIARTVQLVRRAPFLHRLINDELEQAGTEESRARVRAMNLDLVDFYRTLLDADGGDELVEADPLFLYLTVLGASDFFSSAEPLIRELVPEGTDMETLTAGFQEFLAKLVLNGLRKR
jgi:TetR/AcrR family transcriptional regulator